MKKILVFIFIFFTVYIFGQNREMSDYEKYRLSQEEERFNSVPPDTIRDTVYIEIKKESEPIVYNYYNYDYDFGYRHSLYFDTWFYRPYYSYYDPFYYDWYWGYPYYSSYYWGYSPYHHYHYYYPRTYRYYNSRSYNGNYYASSSLGRTKYYNQPHNKTYREGYVSQTRISPSTKTRSQSTSTVTHATRTVRSNTETKVIPNRTYQPTYTTPRVNSRSTYNPPNRPVTRETTTTRSRTEVRTPTSNRNSYSRPSSVSRSSSSSRSYSTPSRSYSSSPRSVGSTSYSTPSRVPSTMGSRSTSSGKK